ncbi:MAG: 1-deoxy-D-xylulose-5-phosphate reductoisomerase, partial [Ruminiclostridium sp.]|nr:1-deoxy-D-xylulose-5-phosphate reductoisomerase [Ruminiclostridium sp.]
RCLALAIRSAKEGKTAPAILNGANEIAVAKFLAGEISFLDIARVVEHALETVPREEADSLAAIRRADKLAREAAEAYCAQR